MPLDCTRPFPAGQAERNFAEWKNRMTETVVFLVVAVALYWVSDKILLRLEERRGARFEHRSLIFFGILLALALASFWGLGRLTGQ